MIASRSVSQKDEVLGRADAISMSIMLYALCLSPTTREMDNIFGVFHHFCCSRAYRESNR